MRKTAVIVLFSVLLTSCYVFKAHRFRNFELKDLDKMDAVQLPSASQPFHFTYDTANQKQLRQYLDENLANSRTYAFLIIRNDTILYERYFGSVTETTKLPSFSVAKSVVSTLVGIALEEGKIKSLQEPVTNYLPELRKNDKRFEQVTIQHVLDMRSGVKSNENYSSPFSDVLKMGFARNVSKPALNAELEQLPGEFDYKSVNTQILALIIEKVTGRKLQDYALEKLWQPLQMEHETTWNADKENTVRAFCCINAAARDYAKFGRLFLHEGNWQGKQLVAKNWVHSSVSRDTMNRYDGYRNQWWSGTNKVYFEEMEKATAFAKTKEGTSIKTFPPKDGGRSRYMVEWRDAFHATGILGQYVYVHPKKNLVIVRLGHNWSHPRFYAQGFIYNLGQTL